MKIITYIKIRKCLLALAVGAMVFSCKQSESSQAADDAHPFQVVLDSLAGVYAPDKRVAQWDVDVYEQDDRLIFTGETDRPEAKEALLTLAASRYDKVTDSIAVLPDADQLEGKVRGVVKISVANLRGSPRHAAELVTQSTLGMPVKVLKKRKNWYYVQSPEGYLAWVDDGGVALMDAEAMKEWKQREKLVYLEPAGTAYAAPNNESLPVTDLVAGNILILEGQEAGFYKVRYPDGRLAFVPQREALPYEQWLEQLEGTEEALVATGMKLMGRPYLWGGTSPKGMDCSGFTKTVYFLNGMVLPRDASQQVHTGVQVDAEKDFQKLRKGDLLFFGRPATDSVPERIIHVGMWIGDMKFIHAMGDVHISNFDREAGDFDQYNYDRYLRTKRVFNQDGPDLTYLKDSDLFVDRGEGKDSL